MSIYDPAYTVPIPNSKITIPDVIIVLSCIIMAIYLLVTLPKAIRRFRESRLQSINLFRAYYFVLWLALAMRIGRSIFWWFKFRRDVDADEQSLANIPWIILRGTIWMAEISLLVLLLHRTTRKFLWVRVIVITVILGILYMGAFAVAIFAFDLPLIGYLKGSGYFWAVHEFIFALFYAVLVVMRCVPSCKSKVPARGAFWVYASLLFLFHVAAGGGYLLRAVESGALSYCVVSVTNALYLSSFGWLLYFAFLWRFLRTDHENKTRLKVYYDDDYDNTSTENYSGVSGEYQLMDDDLMDTPNNSYTPAYARAWQVRKNSRNTDQDSASASESPSTSPADYLM